MQQSTRPAFPEDSTYAIAYVRWQDLTQVYEPEEALHKGTLFPALDKPFYGRRARYGKQICR